MFTAARSGSGQNYRINMNLLWSQSAGRPVSIPKKCWNGPACTIRCLLVLENLTSAVFWLLIDRPAKLHHPEWPSLLSRRSLKNLKISFLLSIHLITFAWSIDLGNCFPFLMIASPKDTINWLPWTLVWIFWDFLGDLVSPPHHPLQSSWKRSKKSTRHLFFISS